MALSSSWSPLLLFHYWEWSPRQLCSELDDLLRKGVHHITSFIPWQGTESDVRHTLERFLQAAAERSLEVSLIVTPELGLPLVDSGFPKELIRKKENWALDDRGRPLIVGLPPRFFALPSFFAPDLLQRYYAFLGKMNRFMLDLERHESAWVDRVGLYVTESVWPYLAFSWQEQGRWGDFSPAALKSFQKQVTHFFSHDEFHSLPLKNANHWKRQGLEDINVQWFFQQATEAFLQRSIRLLSQKMRTPVRDWRFSVPLADPRCFAWQWKHWEASQTPDLLSWASQQVTERGLGYRAQGGVTFYWPPFGGFQSLSEGEKHFLLLKSLLVNPGKMPSLAMDYRDWFQLSLQFRKRYESLQRLLLYEAEPRSAGAIYWTAHVWSTLMKRVQPSFFPELKKKLGSFLQLSATLEMSLSEPRSRLLWVDEEIILTQDRVRKILNWVRLEKRVLVLPRTQLITALGLAARDQVLKPKEAVPVNMGFPYELFAVGEGYCVSFDWPLPKATVTAQASHDLLQARASFLKTILSLADLEPLCEVRCEQEGEAEIEVIYWTFSKPQSFWVFVLNPRSKPVPCVLEFSQAVFVQDGFSNLGQLGSQQAKQVATHFTLEVPAYGVVPLHINRLKEQEASDDVRTQTRLASFSKTL